MKIVPLSNAIKLLLLVGVVLLPQVSLAQDTRAVRQTIIGVPETLEQLSNAATLIVEVHVQSVYPTFEGSGGWETDSVLRIDRVIKGASPGAAVVVGQRGGKIGDREELPAQSFLMQPGERYLLFLTGAPTIDGTHAGRPDLPRYFIFATYAGLLKFEASGLRATRGMTAKFRDHVESRSASEVVSEVAAIVRK